MSINCSLSSDDSIRDEILVPQNLVMKNIFLAIRDEQVISVMIAEDDGVNMLCLTTLLKKIESLKFVITECWDG